MAPVLVVDDDAVAARMVMRTLQHAHLANPVVHLVTGESAIEYLTRHAESGHWPALVLLDIEMPGLSGVEVLRWLREQPDLPSVPVVMVTSSTARDDIRAVYELRVDAFLLKPVAFEALIDVVARLGLPWALFPRPGSAA